MNIRKISIWASASLVLTAIILTGCRIKYSFNGASIDPNAKTFSVAYFPNNASMVAPVLSSTLTDALVDRLAKQTRLVEKKDGPGDLAFEGEITGYVSQPAVITGNEETPTARNRLTIRIRVKFTNALQPQYNYDRSFQQFAEYPVTTALQDAENSLIPEIVDMLVEDVFNAAVANW